MPFLPPNAEWVSAGAVVGFLYTSWAIVWRGSQVVMSRPQPWQTIMLWQPNLREALYAISILVFGFNSSANTISIFSEVGLDTNTLPTFAVLHLACRLRSERPACIFTTRH